ncbi:MAG: 30S ribosomal protein S16, partial [Armatimonadetes bacterium]|nr:30S ribosomal protein S16 [Armatimonadota bacterium]
MAVKIRLRRTGAKHQPSYRLVISNSRSPRDGRFIETIGHYNPRQHDESGNPELYVDPERALYWLDNGAVPTETANSLLKRARILELRHDRNHGQDVSERIAAMSRKTKVAVAEAPTAPPAPA